MVNARYLSQWGARDYANKYKKSPLRRLSAIKEAATVDNALRRVGAAGAILDLPCGAGRFSGIIRRYADTYCAADFSMPMLRICRNGMDGGRNALVLQTDIHAIAVRDRAFDGAVVIRLLHHLPDPAERRAVIGEMARVVKRFLVVTFLDAGSIKQRMHVWKRARQGIPVKRTPIARKDIAGDLRDAGFRVIRFFSLSSLFSGQTVVACVREEV